MSRFIKFSNMIINTLKINKVEIIDNTYCIHMEHNKIDGFFLFSSGYITSHNERITVCKVNHPSDYKILTDWLEKV
jgi:hypothetical protein